MVTEKEHSVDAESQLACTKPPSFGDMTSLAVNSSITTRAVPSWTARVVAPTNVERMIMASRSIASNIRWDSVPVTKEQSTTDAVMPVSASLPSTCSVGPVTNTERSGVNCGRSAWESVQPSNANTCVPVPPVVDVTSTRK